MFTNQSPVRLPKMQDEISLTLHWRSIDAPLTLHWRSIDSPLTLHWRSIDAPLTLHWCSIDTPLTLIFRMVQWPCHLLFCQGRLPVRWLRIAATRSLFNYRTYKSKNRWRSVDAHFHDGAGSMMLLFLTWKAANTSFMNGCNHSPLRLPKMHSQNSLTFCWPSFSEWGSDLIVYSFARKGCQYVGYG